MFLVSSVRRGELALEAFVLSLEASVDFLRETIGTSFEGYTRQSGDRRTPSETEEKEEYTFAKGDLRNFNPGEAVICRQGKGWVHAQIKRLQQ